MVTFNEPHYTFRYRCFHNFRNSMQFEWPLESISVSNGILESISKLVSDSLNHWASYCSWCIFATYYFLIWFIRLVTRVSISKRKVKLRHQIIPIKGDENLCIMSNVLWNTQVVNKIYFAIFLFLSVTRSQEDNNA